MKKLTSEEFDVFFEYLDEVISGKLLKAFPRYLLTKRIKVKNHFKLNTSLNLKDPSNSIFQIEIDVYHGAGSRVEDVRLECIQMRIRRLDSYYTPRIWAGEALDKLEIFPKEIQNFILFNLELLE